MSDKRELRGRILQYYSHIANGNNIKECICEAIFLHPRFNPLVLMEMISSDGRIITHEDIRDYFQNANISYEENDLQKLFVWWKMKKQGINFSDFVQILIPHSPDVLRIYRKNYLDSMEIGELDPEVSFMFRELCQFSLNFVKTLSSIKKQISQFSFQLSKTKGSANKNEKTHKNSEFGNIIQSIIKQDLVNENKKRDKVRESSKYKTIFKENHQNSLGYNDLRRFLEFWQKDRNVEFDLLQIKRYFGDNDPFGELLKSSSLLKGSKSKSKLKQNNSQRQFKTDAKQRNSSNKNSSRRFFTNMKESEYSKQLLDKVNLFDSQKDKFRGSKTKTIFRNLDKQFEGIPTPTKVKEKRSNTKIKDKSGNKVNEKYCENYNENKDEKYNVTINNKDYHNFNKNPLNVPHEKSVKILSFFEFLIEKQQQIQSLRKKLSLNDNFYLINLFKLIDWENKGFVNSDDIREFVEDDQNYRSIVRAFGRQQYILRFQDFCMIFRPLSKKLNEKLDSQQQHKVPNPFKRETLGTIKKILLLTNKFYEKLGSLRQNLQEDHINCQLLFCYIDINDKGYIDFEDFKLFFQQNGLEFDKNGYKLLMKLFRKRITQKITFQDFQNIYQSF